jgi:fatty acid-binding protein DegV
LPGCGHRRPYPPSSAVQGEFLQIFEALREEVGGAVAVTVSGGMGSCHSSALAAKNLVPELPVEVVDSRNCYMGEGFAAQAAAEAARGGGTMEEVARAAREMAEKMHTVFYIDGMEYIRRCGRRAAEDILDKWQKTKV